MTFLVRFETCTLGRWIIPVCGRAARAGERDLERILSLLSRLLRVEGERDLDMLLGINNVSANYKSIEIDQRKETRKKADIQVGVGKTSFGSNRQNNTSINE